MTNCLVYDEISLVLPMMKLSRFVYDKIVFSMMISDQKEMMSQL